MADEPSPGEALRGVAEVTRRLENLADRMERTYVTREVYLRDHNEHERRIGNLEADNEERERIAAATRRQVMGMVLAAVLTGFSSLGVSIALVLFSGLLSR